MSKTTITFEGLMIFHRTADGFYELGILNAQLIGQHHGGLRHDHSTHDVPPHEFRIEISPDPTTGSGKLTKGASELEPFLRQSDRWSLEVKDAKGNIETGIFADESLPDRHSLKVGDKKFGWIINLESSEFHNKDLDRATGKFRPIIRLSKGNLYSFCKSGGLNVIKHKKPKDFGFMAGMLALDIDTSAYQKITLKADGGDDVFVIPGGRDYQVDISNSPTEASEGSHFHVYYDQIFTGVANEDQFDFDNQKGVKHPDECPTPIIKGNFPVKCGGLAVNPGGKPLS